MGKICVKGLLMVLLGLCVAVGVQSGVSFAASDSPGVESYTAVLDCPDGQKRAPVDSKGAFVFKKVAEGECRLTLVSSMVDLATAVDASSARGTSVKAPRDAASGMPTGKRQHKPVTIRIELDGYADATRTQGDAAWEVSPSMVTIKGKPHELKGHVTLIK